MTGETRINEIGHTQELMFNKIELLENRFSGVERQLSTIEVIQNTQPEPGHDKLFEALSKAQAEIQDATQDAEADAGQYKYKYATLSAVLSTVRPVLSKHGLTIIQMPGRKVEDKGVEVLTLTTILGHKSGQSIENYFEMYPTRKDPQGIGSAMTYMRRYVVMAMCAIAGAADDDAEKTVPQKEKITAAQADQIFNTADELFGADSEEMLKRMCQKIHMVEDVRSIPADEYEVAIKRLENQAKKRGTAKEPDKKPSA